jgi:hypothetical protein
MNDNGSDKKTYNVASLGIEETDSCPCCKRLLKGLVEEYDGGVLVGKGGEWICLGCGVMFMPKSKLRKIMERMKEAQSKIIRPQFIPPPGLGRG